MPSPQSIEILGAIARFLHHLRLRPTVNQNPKAGRTRSLLRHVGLLSHRRSSLARLRRFSPRAIRDPRQLRHILPYCPCHLSESVERTASIFHQSRRLTTPPPPLIFPLLLLLI